MSQKRSSIGTDPEFFIVNERTKKAVNAEKMFPGTKDNPYPMKSGSGLQTDNVAVEFASSIARDGKDLVDNIRNTFKELLKYVPKDHMLDVTPTLTFDSDELQTDQSQRFGCDPSYCAWELKENNQPDAGNTNMRSIGGHIHVGKVDDDGNDFLLDPYGKIDVVRTMDAFHGIISVVLDNTKESINRRKLYGSAGEHRPKDYGVEYRTLSSFWLKSPNLVMFMDSLTQDVLRLIREDKHTKIIEEIGIENIRVVINTGDNSRAKDIINKILYKHMSDDSKYYFHECVNNIKSYILEKEWEL